MFRATIEDAGLLEEWYQFKREAAEGDRERGARGAGSAVQIGNVGHVLRLLFEDSCRNVVRLPPVTPIQNLELTNARCDQRIVKRGQELTKIRKPSRSSSKNDD